MTADGTWCHLIYEMPGKALTGFVAWQHFDTEDETPYYIESSDGEFRVVNSETVVPLWDYLRPILGFTNLLELKAHRYVNGELISD